MHILILPSWYPRETSDYSGSFFREQAMALAQAGLKVGVFAFVRHTRGRLLRNPGYWFGRLQRENDAGVDTWRIHYGAYSQLAGVVTKRLLKSYFKQYCLQEGTPDLLHAHSAIDGGTRAMWLAQDHGLPYVITEHATAFTRSIYSNAQLARAQAAFAHAQTNIVVSASVCSDIRATGLSLPNHMVIPNIIPPSIEDAPWPPPPRDQTAGFRFLCIGSLIERKGHHILLAAFAARFRGQPVSLTIGGAGPLQDQLAATCEALRIADQVRFAGRMTREQVRQEIDHSDALILASANETFGVVLVEATARGKPIIATDCGGPRDIVNSNNGFLVKPDSVDQLEIAMMKLVNGYHYFSPERIRAQCLATFSRHVVCASMIELYQQILTGDRDEQATPRIPWKRAS